MRAMKKPVDCQTEARMIPYMTVDGSASQLKWTQFQPIEWKTFSTPRSGLKSQRQISPVTMSDMARG